MRIIQITPADQNQKLYVWSVKEDAVDSSSDNAVLDALQARPVVAWGLYECYQDGESYTEVHALVAGESLTNLVNVLDDATVVGMDYQHPMHAMPHPANKAILERAKSVIEDNLFLVNTRNNTI